VIVLDSSFIVGFHNERDAHHDAARGWMERLLKGEWGRGPLLEYVFLEVTTVLQARRDVGVAADVGRLLLDADELDFVPCSDLFADAFGVFVRQGRAGLSFADAAIAHVAKNLTGGRVLTFDASLKKFPGIRVPA
jgi:predicted nucleic acid-binding protein